MPDKYADIMVLPMSETVCNIKTMADIKEIIPTHMTVLCRSRFSKALISKSKTDTKNTASVASLYASVTSSKTSTVYRMTNDHAAKSQAEEYFLNSLGASCSIVWWDKRMVK